MVAVAHTGQTGGVVDGCTTVAGSTAVLHAEGLESYLIVLCQDGPHLQAVVEGARHMEGHDTGGHGALGEWETEKIQLKSETELESKKDRKKRCIRQTRYKK